jgi:2-polyprenyl-3-methyl-5-hydroxy-6-metoxy-1,4-benzoquinol methylase
MMACPVCAAQTPKHMRTLWDDRYAYPGTYRLLRCKTCTHEYLEAHFSDAELTELYTKYYPRRKFDPAKVRAHEPRDGVVSWLDGDRSGAFRWVPEKVRILDIGCGFGQTLLYHRNRGCDVAGTELDENAREVASLHQLDVRIGAFSADVFEEASFDVVTLDQVMEHLQDPRQVLLDVRRVVRPGGRVIISTPRSRCINRVLFGQRWAHWHTPYHLQFFTEPSMEKLAGQTGFKLVQSMSVTNSAWTNFQWHHFLTYPKQGQPSQFWSGIHMSRSKNYAARVLKLLHKTYVNHLITRLEDVLQRGDNQLFILEPHA